MKMLMIIVVIAAMLIREVHGGKIKPTMIQD